MRTRGADPGWTYEEHLLALDLYHRAGRSALPASDERVVQLSKVLNAMDLHAVTERKTVFRSPGSVSLQLKHYRALEAGAKADGLGKIGKLHRTVWSAYNQRPAALRRIADAIAKAFLH